MCVPRSEFQLINPTTQVALFSLCVGNCKTIENIQWNVYYGEMNSSSDFIKWILFNQNTYFFGKNICLNSISIHYFRDKYKELHSSKEIIS
jgi:hypothetical protein